MGASFAYPVESRSSWRPYCLDQWAPACGVMRDDRLYVGRRRYKPDAGPSELPAGNQFAHSASDRAVGAAAMAQAARHRDKAGQFRRPSALPGRPSLAGSYTFSDGWSDGF